jgi:hypothetical protein
MDPAILIEVGLLGLLARIRRDSMRTVGYGSALLATGSALAIMAAALGDHANAQGKLDASYTISFAHSRGEISPRTSPSAVANTPFLRVATRNMGGPGPSGAAQRRIVSVARIRLDPRESVRPFKGIICGHVSEFESHMPSTQSGLPELGWKTLADIWRGRPTQTRRRQHLVWNRWAGA